MTFGRLANRRVRGTLVASAFLLAGCSSLLDVHNPNDVPEDKLGDFTAAAAIANGVVGATSRMLSGVTVPYAVATDELDWIGSRDAWFDLETGGIANYLNEFTDAEFPFVGEARFLSDSAVARLVYFDTLSTLSATQRPNRVHLARAYLYGAVVYATIPDIYDDFAFSSKRTPAKPIGRANMGTLYDKAVQYLDKSYAIAAASGVTASDLIALRYQIVAYRARVKHAKQVWASITPKLAPNAVRPLALVNDAGANGDAALALGLPGVANDQRFTLVNNIEATTGNIYIWFEVNGRNEHRTGSVYRTLVDPLTTSTLDATVQSALSQFTTSGGPAPAPPGAPTQAGTFTLTSNRELRLILAEAALAAANTAEFDNQINLIRALDSKPAFTGQISRQAMLQHERQAQLWLMRRRLADMYRFNLKDSRWQNNPNFESAFSVNGLLFPIPNIERLGNPCIENPTAPGC